MSIQKIFANILNSLPLLNVLIEEEYFVEKAERMLRMTYKTITENNLSLQEREVKCLLMASFLYDLDIDAAKYVMECNYFEPIEVYNCTKYMRIETTFPNESWQLIPFFVNIITNSSNIGLQYLLRDIKENYTLKTPRIKVITDINEKLLKRAAANNSKIDSLYIEFNKIQKLTVKNYHLLTNFPKLQEEFNKNIQAIQKILLTFCNT